MNIEQAEIRSKELKKICCILFIINVNLLVIKTEAQKPLISFAKYKPKP